jgi:hypothetical protein
MKSDRNLERWIWDQRIIMWGPAYRKLPFPALLYTLLACGQFTSDLWWVQGGKAFAINREGYIKNIMSVFFDEHKFRSLQTILHKYGFRRLHAIIGGCTDIIIYQHDQFVEGDIESCMMITRVKKCRHFSTAPEICYLPMSDNCFVTTPPSSIDSFDTDADLDSCDCCSLMSVDTTRLRAEG